MMQPSEKLIKNLSSGQSFGRRMTKSNWPLRSMDSKGSGRRYDGQLSANLNASRSMILRSMTNIRDWFVNVMGLRTTTNTYHDHDYRGSAYEAFQQSAP